MSESVQIKRGDLICINVATETLWIEKEQGAQTDSPSPVPTFSFLEKGEMKRHCPTNQLFKGIKYPAAYNAAYTLAYTVAWAAGFGVGNDTDLYLHTKDTYVFKVL
jgi:hypothetical protein